MDPFFKPQPTSHGGGLIFSEFIYPRKGLLASLAKVKAYHRENPQGLNGSHFLIKLLMSLNVPLALDTQTYHDRVSDVALNLAMSLKMTSGFSSGKYFEPGVFYGKGVGESLIAHIDPFDLELLESDWQNLSPFEVISHPKTDLHFPLLTGKYHSIETGSAVIKINIPMLAGQYRKWRQYDQSLNHDSPRTVMQFLTLYPLPNLLDSHLDVSVYNRLVHTFFDEKMPDTPNPCPFYLTDYRESVDRTLEHFLSLVESKRWTFDMLLSHVPQVVASDFHSRIKLPDMAYSQQMQWALAVARVPLIAFLVRFNYLTDNERNQPYLNRFRRWIRQLRLNHALNVLPRRERELLEDVIDVSIEPYLYVGE